MLKRQLGLLVISTILLSTTLVHAAEISEVTNSSISNTKTQISDLGAIIMHTPDIDINTTKVIVGRVSIDLNHRRNRKVPSVRRRQVIPSVAILRQRVMNKINQVESSARAGTSTTRTSTNDAGTVSEQNIQCSGSGSSVVQSSQTINGRTVSSETRTNCN